MSATLLDEIPGKGGTEQKKWIANHFEYVQQPGNSWSIPVPEYRLFPKNLFTSPMHRSITTEMRKYRRFAGTGAWRHGGPEKFTT